MKKTTRPCEANESLSELATSHQPPATALLFILYPSGFILLKAALAALWLAGTACRRRVLRDRALGPLLDWRAARSDASRSPRDRSRRACRWRLGIAAPARAAWRRRRALARG